MGSATNLPKYKIVLVLAVAFAVIVTIIAIFMAIRLKTADAIIAQQNKLISDQETYRNIQQGRIDLICSRAPQACFNIE